MCSSQTCQSAFLEILSNFILNSLLLLCHNHSSFRFQTSIAKAFAFVRPLHHRICCRPISWIGNFRIEYQSLAARVPFLESLITLSTRSCNGQGTFRLISIVSEVWLLVSISAMVFSLFSSAVQFCVSFHQFAVGQFPSIFYTPWARHLERLRLRF